MAKRTVQLACVVTVGALTALAIGSAGAGAQTPRALVKAHPAASSLHGWRQLSSGPAKGIGSIGLARIGSSLQVVWSGYSTGSKETLNTRTISASGALTSPAIQVEKWATINDYPQVIPFSGERAIVFSGIRSANSSDPYVSGAEYYATSADGKKWDLTAYQMSNNTTAYGSYGSDSEFADGNAVLVYTSSSANAVSYHEGYQPLTTGLPADPTTTPEPGADVYNAGVGYDPKAKQFWTVWSSLSSHKNTLGVSAQRIVPTGPRVHAPHTVTPYAGMPETAEVNQRIDVAARPKSAGGGVYAAYPVGYPTADKISLWKLGSSKSLLFGAGNDVAVADIAPGAGGRLWVIWFDRGHAVIHVARTNVAATRIGATCAVTTPHDEQYIYSLAGDGAKGPLQVVINGGSNISATKIYSTVVQPCLQVSVSPSHVAPGGHVTVSVSDAGSPVGGAHVVILGVGATTDSHGVAHLRIPSGAHAGSHTVAVSRAGYQHTQAHVHIT
jgi:hypothetical protein